MLSLHPVYTRTVYLDVAWDLHASKLSHCARLNDLDWHCHCCHALHVMQCCTGLKVVHVNLGLVQEVYR